MGKIREKLEKWAAAAAFAEAGDHDTASEIMEGPRRKRKTARKAARKERRAEMRAD